MAVSGNPNHPVVKKLDQEWHKLCAILIRMMGVDTVEILPEDVAAIQGMNIVADARNGRFLLYLVNDEDAERLAKEAGGLPF